jgi:hypothetical protein
VIKTKDAISISAVLIIFAVGISASFGFVMGYAAADKHCALTALNNLSLSDILTPDNIDKFCESKGYSNGFIDLYYTLPSGIRCSKGTDEARYTKLFSFDDIYEVV